eukprot:Platyproteum_vivax@DN1100_c0_g1_i2.p1
MRANPQAIDHQVVIDVPADFGAHLNTFYDGETIPPIHVDLQVNRDDALLTAKIPTENNTTETKFYRGRVRELPCFCETFKTSDGKHFYKSADVSQLIYFNNVPDATSHATTEENKINKHLTSTNDNSKLMSGLTPGTKKIRRRKFNEQFGNVWTKEILHDAEVRLWAIQSGAFREEVVKYEDVMPEVVQEDKEVQGDASRVITSKSELLSILRGGLADPTNMGPSKPSGSPSYGRKRADPQFTGERAPRGRRPMSNLGLGSRGPTLHGALMPTVRPSSLKAKHKLPTAMRPPPHTTQSIAPINTVPLQPTVKMEKKTDRPP